MSNSLRKVTVISKTHIELLVVSKEVCIHGHPHKLLQLFILQYFFELIKTCTYRLYTC